MNKTSLACQWEAGRVVQLTVAGYVMNTIVSPLKREALIGS